MAYKRRRKHKLKINWTLFWLLTFCSVLVAGLFTSELTHLNTVRIEGVPTYDQDRINTIIKKFQKVPALQINPLEVQSYVEENTQIASSEFSRNVFGRALLKVRYRKPIARLGKTGHLYVDESGHIFRLKEKQKVSFIISRNVLVSAINLTICDPSPLPQASQLAKKLQVILPKLEGNIALDSRGRLYFLYEESVRVVVGDDTQLDKKVQVLADSLAADPGLWQKTKEINLVDPDRPMKVMRSN